MASAGSLTDRVRRAVFRISAADERDLLQWRTRLASDGGAVEQALARACEGLTSAQELVLIDRLEVDLGTLAEHDLSLDKLTRALRLALEQALVKAENRETLPHGAPLAASDTPIRVPLAYSASQSFLSYLATGSLGPRSAFDDLATLVAALDPASLAVALAGYLRRASDARLWAALVRLHAAMPSAEADTLLRAAFPDLPQTPPEAARATSPRDAPPVPLSATASGPASAQERAARSVVLLHAFFGKLPAPPAAPPAHGPARSAEVPAPSALSPPEPENDRPDPQPTALPHKVQNAGMVLLHPFLRIYFRGLGLVSDKVFVSDAAQIKAARLLHALVTRDTDPPEPALDMPRLLCAVPDHLPLVDGPPDPGHLALGEEMLEAVIGQWQALGNTSPDGLREGFLQRPGVLDLSGDTALLRVERRTIDVLVDRLPWVLSVIRLPWMDAPLQVDWV